MAFDEEQIHKRREDRAKEHRRVANQMKLLKIGVIVTVIITLLCSGLLVAFYQGWLPDVLGGTTPPETTPSVPTEAPPPTTEAPPSPDTVIHLIAGGDLNVTEKTVASGATDGGYNYGDVFLDAIPALSSGDLTLLNFEGFVSDDPNLTGAPQQLLQALKASGVDILQTANSKSISGGLLGLTATLDAIRGADMEALGTYKSTQEFEQYQGFTVREIQGIRIAFVAFTKGMGGMGLPLGSENCVNLLYEDYATTYQKVDESGIRKVLRDVADAKPDLTVALLHWGSEYNSQISKTQETILKLMQKEGVDAIIGTHSHYVQQITLDPETGTFVAYSLGDFYGDADRTGTEYSIVLDLEITKNGATGEVSITGFAYTPMFTVTDEAGNPLRVMRIREAIAAYEENSVNRVSEEIYTKMKSALKQIESKIK